MSYVTHIEGGRRFGDVVAGAAIYPGAAKLTGNRTVQQQDDGDARSHGHVVGSTDLAEGDKVALVAGAGAFLRTDLVADGVAAGMSLSYDTAAKEYKQAENTEHVLGIAWSVDSGVLVFETV